MNSILTAVLLSILSAQTAADMERIEHSIQQPVDTEETLVETDYSSRIIHYKEGPIASLFYDIDSETNKPTRELYIFFKPVSFSEIKQLYPKLKWNGSHQNEKHRYSEVVTWIQELPWGTLVIPARIEWKNSKQILPEEGIRQHNVWLATEQAQPNFEAHVHTLAIYYGKRWDADAKEFVRMGEYNPPMKR